MLNRTLQAVVLDYMGSQQHDSKLMTQLNREAHLLTQQLHGGVIVIGDMLEMLGAFAADEKQDYSREAVSPQSANRLGATLKAQGYFLELLHEVETDSDYYLNQQEIKQTELKSKVANNERI